MSDTPERRALPPDLVKIAEHIRRREEEAALYAEQQRHIEDTYSRPMRELQPLWNDALRRLWGALTPLFDGGTADAVTIAAALAPVGEAIARHDRIPHVRDQPSSQIEAGFCPRSIEARLGLVINSESRFESESPKLAAGLLRAAMTATAATLAPFVESLLASAGDRATFGWLLPLATWLAPGEGYFYPEWTVWATAADESQGDPATSACPMTPARRGAFRGGDGSHPWRVTTHS
jgi:hypothetical protein